MVDLPSIILVYLLTSGWTLPPTLTLTPVPKSLRHWICYGYISKHLHSKSYQVNWGVYVSGLRARMGAGYSMMNDLTIIQTTQVLLVNDQRQFSPQSILWNVANFTSVSNNFIWHWWSVDTAESSVLLVYLNSGTFVRASNLAILNYIAKVIITLIIHPVHISSVTGTVFCVHA